jgi:hypothetical protein
MTKKILIDIEKEDSNLYSISISFVQTYDIKEEQLKEEIMNLSNKFRDIFDRNDLIADNEYSYNKTNNIIIMKVNKDNFLKAIGKILDLI